MPAYLNKELIDLIRNGTDEFLFYLTDKYYQSARRLLRRSGCPDKETPIIFSRVIVSACHELQQSKLSTVFDFEQYFYTSLIDYYKNNNSQKNLNVDLIHSHEKEVAVACFSILDELKQKLLAARYSGKLSFEQIAVKFNFSNPVIAQFEVNRAFLQYENVVKARLNWFNE
jgi:hypothetical protein